MWRCGCNAYEELHMPPTKVLFHVKICGLFFPCQQHFFSEPSIAFIVVRLDFFVYTVLSSD